MIDEHTVRHVARLARLRLSGDDEETMRRELSGILAHIDVIRAINLDGVPPTTHVIALQNVLRDDIPRTGLTRDEAVREAASAVDGTFDVPRMD
ncbi:MAG: Asp-tRNA(Asn)/Glu-tRNA(Gln) amidotransferase subunit GatC [Thermoleophilia bacterium]|nr:Asp-tRNA(Asn)/Glu-tRNA(Gln) amidotransferase subunit GatC [Thermoleophilia bacterium]